MKGKRLNLQSPQEWRGGILQKSRCGNWQCELCGKTIMAGDSMYRRGSHGAHAGCVDRLKPESEEEGPRRCGGRVPASSSSRANLDAMQRNQQALEKCAGHEFVDLELERTLVKRFRCIRCGGEVGLIEMRWYERGREHAQRKAVA